MKSTIPLFFWSVHAKPFGFSVMRNLGYGHVLELRWFNILFLAVGIGMGIQMVKRSFPSKFNYMEGLKVGLSISLLAISAFASFVYLVALVDEGFMLKIIETQSTFRYLNPELLSLINLVEGSVLGLILTIIIMQFQQGSYVRRILNRIG